MTTQIDDGRAQALVAAGWPDVLDRLLQGVGHDLNNRVQTLLSLVQLLQLEEDVTSLTPYLEKEVGQLEEAVTLLRLIPGQPGEEPELIHLPDFLPPLVRLSGIHKGLEDVRRELEVDADGLMPVRAPWTLLGRTALVLLAAGGHESFARERAIQLRVRPDEGHVVLEAAVPGEDRGIDRPEESGRRSGIAGLATLLNGDYEEEEGDGITLRLKLPFPTRG